MKIILEDKVEGTIKAVEEENIDFRPYGFDRRYIAHYENKNFFRRSERHYERRIDIKKITGRGE